MMNVILIGALVVVVLAIIGVIVWRRRPRKLKTEKYHQRWQAAQKLCAREESWPDAIMAADKILEDVLKKSRYKGRTMGEKLVSAQHDITSNESIWYAHKLRNKLVSKEIKKLKKKDVMDALIGFRGTLKDLGALEKPAEAVTDEAQT